MGGESEAGVVEVVVVGGGGGVGRGRGEGAWKNVVSCRCCFSLVSWTTHAAVRVVCAFLLKSSEGVRKIVQ